MDTGNDITVNKPKSLGYYMPAEWHQHSATLMHWPVNRETWPGERLQRVEAVYLNILEALSTHEPVHLLIPNNKAKTKILKSLENRLAHKPNIFFHILKTNDVWARDCGPICIIRNGPSGEEVAITDWGYNAWGGKYPPYDADNAIPGYFAEKYHIDRYDPGMILEGGSIDTNGSGVILTTESVLLNPNRNPELGKTEIERRIFNYLGQEQVIWLDRGLAGDDTDGHIDDLARFLNKDTILSVISYDPNDVNYTVLRDNLERLQSAADNEGNPFNIETLPMPETRIVGTTVDGSEYVPASYANFYIANDVVLVPLYDSRYDNQALEFFKHYYKDREVVGIQCADLVWGQGSIHCITQQLYGIKE